MSVFHIPSTCEVRVGLIRAFSDPKSLFIILIGGLSPNVGLLLEKTQVRVGCILKTEYIYHSTVPCEEIFN